MNDIYTRHDRILERRVLDTGRSCESVYSGKDWMALEAKARSLMAMTDPYRSPSVSDVRPSGDGFEFTFKCYGLD